MWTLKIKDGLVVPEDTFALSDDSPIFDVYYRGCYRSRNTGRDEERCFYFPSMHLKEFFTTEQKPDGEPTEFTYIFEGNARYIVSEVGAPKKEFYTNEVIWPSPDYFKEKAIERKKKKIMQLTEEINKIGL